MIELLHFDPDGYKMDHAIRDGCGVVETHYGRLVTTDDQLMLFSDPMEAMEHLM